MTVLQSSALLCMLRSFLEMCTCAGKASGHVQELLKAMSLTAGLALPTWALFYFIGTCLWAFYRAFPTPAVQALQPDAVFPALHQAPTASRSVKL